MAAAVLADALHEHHPRSPAPALDDFALSVPAGTVDGLLGLILAVFVPLSVHRFAGVSR